MSAETFPQSPFPDGWLRLFFFVTKKEGASLTSSVKAYSVRAVATSLAFFQSGFTRPGSKGRDLGLPQHLHFFLPKDLSLIQGDLS